MPRGEPEEREPHQDEEDEALGVRGVWSLFEDEQLVDVGGDRVHVLINGAPKPETPFRLHAAQQRAWDAYNMALANRGLVAVKRHHLADERMAQAEQYIAKQQARREQEDRRGDAADERSEDMSEERERSVLETLKAGPCKMPALAKAVGLGHSVTSAVVRELVAAGKVQKHGTQGPAVFYSLPGDTRELVKSKVGRKPKAAPRAARVQHTTAKITVADVSGHVDGSGFTVKIGALEVQCSSAAQVLELAKTFGKAS